MTPEIPYKRKAVEPVECIKTGWELVKPQYWLFVGMCIIGYVIGTAVPLGILMGPMMAGLYLTFFALRRREPIEFATLFKGFEFFGPSLVATLLHAIPVIAIVLPTYLLFYVSFVVAVMAQSQSQNPNPLGVLGVFPPLMRGENYLFSMLRGRKHSLHSQHWRAGKLACREPFVRQHTYRTL